MGFQCKRLPGVTLRGSGAYFPERTITNDEVFDVVLRHALTRDDRHGPWGALRHAGARLGGEVLRAYLRRRYSSTDELVRRFGFPPGIVEKMGIARRQWAHPVGTRPADGPHSLDFALEAARMALDNAGLAPSEVDALVVTTTTPPRINSSSALWLADRLGIVAPAYDLRAGCSGGLYALLNASLYLQHGCRNVLVVGAEAYSRFVSPCSRDAIFLAGDGAGAVVLTRSDDAEGVLAGLIGADGRYDRGFSTRGPMPPTSEAASRGHYYVEGDPRELVEANLKTYLAIIPEVLALAERGIGDIAYHVPHQTSLSVIKAVARHIGHPMDRTFVNLHEHGNIGSACLLAALHEARAAGKVNAGETLLLSVVGGTLTWGAMVWRP